MVVFSARENLPRIAVANGLPARLTRRFFQRPIPAARPAPCRPVGISRARQLARPARAPGQLVGVDLLHSRPGHVLGQGLEHSREGRDQQHHHMLSHCGSFVCGNDAAVGEPSHWIDRRNYDALVHIRTGSRQNAPISNGFGRAAPRSECPPHSCTREVLWQIATRTDCR